jgi:hypothetical protein
MQLLRVLDHFLLWQAASRQGRVIWVVVKNIGCGFITCSCSHIHFFMRWFCLFCLNEPAGRNLKYINTKTYIYTQKEQGSPDRVRVHVYSIHAPCHDIDTNTRCHARRSIHDIYIFFMFGFIGSFKLSRTRSAFSAS